MGITIEGLRNFRDVGGMPLRGGGSVRSGVLYRAEGLAAVTDAGLDALAESPIGVIADFRTEAERQQAPDRLPPSRSFEVLNLSVLEGALTGAASAAARGGAEMTPELVAAAMAQLPRLDELYLRMLEHGADAFARTARAVAASRDDEPTAVLVHCTAGKDRTGVAVALILDAVGADRAAIVADDAQSEQKLAGEWADRMLAGIRGMGAPLTPAIVELVTRTPPAAIATALAWIDARGGATAYLRSGGLDDDELTALRTRLAG